MANTMLLFICDLMLDYELMYQLVEPHQLHFTFCMDSKTVSARSLRHRALVNATIQAKFPPNSTLLPCATAQVEDALRAAAQVPGHHGTRACSGAAQAAETRVAGT